MNVISTGLSKSLNHKHVVDRKFPLVNFKPVWGILGNKMIDPFARDFCWKMINDILPLNSLLFKRNISR